MTSNQVRVPARNIIKTGLPGRAKLLGDNTLKIEVKRLLFDEEIMVKRLLTILVISMSVFFFTINLIFILSVLNKYDNRTNRKCLVFSLSCT